MTATAAAAADNERTEICEGSSIEKAGARKKRACESRQARTTPPTPTMTMTMTHLGDLAGLADGVDAHAHLLDVVEAVEHPEDVDPVLGGEADKLRHHVVRVGRVADRVRAADEHLRT